MRVIQWLSDHILLIITLFLLGFIPLYPKLPILDVPHTWVYIRIEDFLVALSLVILGIQLLRKKATLRSPLLLPILIFWIIGGISTLFAVLFIFPNLANVFPSVAILHYARRIEYLSVFFIAFAAVKDKRMVPFLVGVLTVTLLLVIGYGVGQKLYPDSFHAYLTMNEEFAKGIPLRLSAAARIPSTFAGHYDLAAYLVLMIPIMASLVFGFRHVLLKFLFVFSAGSGLVLLLMTASRVSFAVYLATITFLFVLHKKKVFIIPVIVLSILLLNSFQGISQRFGDTISSADVVVDARTGKVIAIVPQGDEGAIDKSKQNVRLTPTPIVIEDIEQTGESLPRAPVAVLNFPTDAEEKTITQFFIKRSKLKTGTESAQITSVEGDFVVKRVLTYDISFTTRFQGEWPRAMQAFQRNYLLGSGFSSISLATDNNYLRILGEAGILGLSSFVFIFIIFSVYVEHVLRTIDEKLVRSLALGVLAGLFGLGLNAILIDVFEASKVAFILWLLMGVTVGLLRLYQKQSIDYLSALKRIFTSVPAIIVYLLIATYFIFSSTLTNYFVGDDFTWLRWAADCKKVLYTSGALKCQSVATTIQQYFTQADGFFFRPGMKLYFLLMYAVFWLDPYAYHVGLVFLHFAVTALVFLISLSILRNKFFALVTASFFLVASVHSEAVLWVSSLGHVGASLFTLLALFCFMVGRQKKRWYLFPLSILCIFAAMTMHELGIVAPLLILAYDTIMVLPVPVIHILKRWYYCVYLLTIPLYLSVRYLAQSHWLSGDYSYKASMFLFNSLGNSIGYIGLILIGPLFMPWYQAGRVFGRTNMGGVFLVLIVFGLVAFVFSRFAKRFVTKEFIKMVVLSLALFLVSLLPFLGLGNVSLRYGYLASFGIFLLCSFLLLRLYRAMASVHRGVAVICVGIIVVGFISFNLLELYRVNQDWRRAGVLANKVIISVKDAYGKRVMQNPVFYIVNPPIRYGEAWVFPVGLKDALWFVFQSEHLTVETPASLDLALDAAEGSASAKVLEVDPLGHVNEVVRTQETIRIPTKKEK